MQAPRRWLLAHQPCRVPSLSRPLTRKASWHTLDFLSIFSAKSVAARTDYDGSLTLAQDAFFQPYLPLQQVDLLQETKSWLCGTTNTIVTHQKDIELLVNVCCDSNLTDRSAIPDPLHY